MINYGPGKSYAVLVLLYENVFSHIACQIILRVSLAGRTDVSLVSTMMTRMVIMFSGGTEYRYQSKNTFVPTDICGGFPACIVFVQPMVRNRHQKMVGLRIRHGIF
jgi:hypothetical protein